MVVTSQYAGTSNWAARPTRSKARNCREQAQRLGLHDHVRDGLAQVVQREFGVVPVGVFDEAMTQVRDEEAGG
jgi:hypothetical protein